MFRLRNRRQLISLKPTGCGLKPCVVLLPQVYTIYSILSLVFVILIIVTAFITIALTYFQLAVEDHGWWWRSFLCGGSTGAPSPRPKPHHP